GDTIICEFKIEKYERQDKNRIAFIATFLCKNQNEKEVLKGDVSGVIL
ncbi:enoyl-CoA hydratase, partial [Neobacillus niacini]